jgi:hypothetical protein
MEDFNTYLLRSGSRHGGHVTLVPHAPQRLPLLPENPSVEPSNLDEPKPIKYPRTRTTSKITIDV